MRMTCGPIAIIDEFKYVPCTLNDELVGPNSVQVGCMIHGTKSIEKFFIKDKPGVKHSVTAKESSSYPVCNDEHAQEIRDTTYSFKNSPITLTVHEDLRYKGSGSNSGPKPNL